MILIVCFANKNQYDKSICALTLTLPFLLSFSCAVGVEAEASKISQLLSELEGKDVDEVIAAGKF